MYPVLLTQIVSEVPNNSGSNTLSALFGLLVFAAVLAARWQIFTKMGEEGWVSLIPFYSRYLMYKKCWNGTYYFISLFALIPTVILAAAAALVYCSGSGPEFAMVLAMWAVLTGLVPLVLNLILTYKISRAFGHGILFTIGCLLMNNLFTIILGFGKDKYQPAMA